jgi:alpha-tubulin suppressor-like RCC1 family protein
MPIELDKTNIIINNNSTTSNIFEVIKSKGSYTEKAADSATYSCGGGYLGHGDDTSTKYKPTSIQYFIDNSITISHVYACDDHSIFLDTNGNVYSCGEGDFGRLGHGNNSDKYTPTLIQYFIDESITISKISAGNSHSIFLATDGNVYSCGRGTYGRLGHGNTNSKYTPTLIETYIDYNGNNINYTNITISHVSAGYYHSLFVDTNGNVYSCGRNSYGQLGHGNTSEKSTPTLIQYFIDNSITISRVYAGDFHSIFLDTNGNVYSCGRGNDGQLGHGNTSNKNTPTLIQYFIDESITISKFSAGYYHSIFLATDGNVYSCGLSSYGRLGHGNTNSKYTPTLIETYIDYNGNNINYTNITISHVSAGYYHSLFVDTNGNVYSCGRGNYGKLGHGNTSDKSTPTLIQYFDTYNITISHVSAGYYHSIFFSNDPYYQTIEYPAQWTYSSTDASVYHLGNVGIGTEADTSKSLTITGDINVDGNIFIDDVKMNLPKYKYSLYDNEPTISNNIISSPAPDNLTHKYIAFTYDSTRDTSGQTEYTINFPADTTCDILIVGGGGGGGGRHGAGGGAGGLLYIQNELLLANTLYIVKIGKGGGGGNTSGSAGGSGTDSDFNALIAIGGGGGSSHDNGTPKNGGSGGGDARSGPGLGTLGQGHDGGNRGSNYNHGGGGGAGGAGKDGTSSKSGDGGEGLELDITGTLTYYAGGGGGGSHDPAGAQGLGGNGGGGNGGLPGGKNIGFDGEQNTGGGGGGSSVNSSTGGGGGAGGSGIVIIRYAAGTLRNYLSNWTYSSSYDEVSLMGYVGIGKTPTSELDIDGSFIANAKNFKIEHPIVNNMHLYHACIEGPRFDNIYRGKKVIVNGYCEVDIDTECNNTGGMIPGTFVALNTDYQLYLQNNQTFDKVKGHIEDGKIKITSLNTTDNILVDWLVIGERQDRGIIKSSLTNAKGKLICEH